MMAIFANVNIINVFARKSPSLLEMLSPNCLPCGDHLSSSSATKVPQGFPKHDNLESDQMILNYYWDSNVNLIHIWSAWSQQDLQNCHQRSWRFHLFWFWAISLFGQFLGHFQTCFDQQSASQFSLLCLPDPESSFSASQKLILIILTSRPSNISFIFSVLAIFLYVASQTCQSSRRESTFSVVSFFQLLLSPSNISSLFFSVYQFSPLCLPDLPEQQRREQLLLILFSTAPSLC